MRIFFVVNLVNKWVVYDQEVHLLQNGDLKVLDITTKNEVLYPFPKTHGIPIKEFISYMCPCDVLLEKGKPPYFFKPFKWTVGEKEVSLLFSKTNDLMCQVFDKRTRKSVQHDAFECILPSYRCHAETIETDRKDKNKIYGRYRRFFGRFYRIQCCRS